MSSTGLHTLQVLESDTQVGVSSLASSPSGDDLERSFLDTVLELCDESASQILLVHPELPTFAEQSYTDHQIDLVPANKKLIAREKSLRASGDWTALSQLLIERAELTHSEVEAARLLMQAAVIYQEQLGNLASARAIALKALEVDPCSLDAAGIIESFARQHGDWPTLIESFTSAAESLNEDEPARAGEFWIRVACAYAVARNDSGRAFARLAHVRAGCPKRLGPYLDALEGTIRHSEDLEVMLAACSRIGDDQRSARLLSRAIAMSQSVFDRANYHHRIAIIELNRSEDEAAQWHWQEALRLHPKHQHAREALGALYEDRGEFRKALAVLDEARAVAMHAGDRARFALQAAQIHREHLGENTRAIDLCAVALQLEPGHREASLHVVQRYHQQGRWAELAPVVDSLLLGSKLQYLADGDRVELFLIAAECAMELGQFAKARDHYGQCLIISPRELVAVLGCARSSLAAGDYGDAIAKVELAIDLHEHAGDSAATVAGSVMIASEANRLLGKIDRAKELFLFCVDHGQPGALRALAEIYTSEGDHRAAVDMRLRYAEELEPEPQLQILCEVADTLEGELQDIRGAIDVCEQALDVNPDSRASLHRLAVLYSKDQQWRAAIKVIVRMAGLEQSALRRARYLQAAGDLARQAEQRVEAVALFNKAIDSYVSDTVMIAQDDVRRACFLSFRSIVQLLSEEGDWRGVEQNYRRMICRLEPGDSDVPGLWTELGHVYREKLGEAAAAIDSFEVASSLDASKLTNHRILIDLYEGAGADKLESAIARRRLLLEKEPDSAEHYKALRSLYVRTRQMDAVFCLCRALDFMGAADDSERAFHRRKRSASITWPSRPMNSEMRSRLRDPMVDPLVSRIFGLVAEVIAQDRAVSPAHVQLEDVQDPQFDQLQQLFSATSYALGLPTFDCFVQARQSEALRLHNLRRATRLAPTFVLGSALFAGRTMHQIVDALGRSMFFGRRSYYLRLLLDAPADLAAAFYAAVTLVRPDVAVPAGVGARVRQYRAALAKGLHPSWRKKLEEAVTDFLRASLPLDLSAWLEGVDASARHTGLLLSGDLSVSAAALCQEPNMSDERRLQLRNRLVLDSISESHLSLRADLGLAIA